MTDFFVPEKNEQELTKTALAMNIKDFVFLYGLKEYEEKYNKDHNKINEGIKKKGNIKDDNFKRGVLLKGDYKINDLIKASKISDFVVVESNDNLRQVLERMRNIYVYGCENLSRPDFIHHRNSGLNHILANIAKKNNTKFLFNFEDFVKKDKIKKSLLFGRLKQNLVLYRKYDLDFSFASFASNKFMIKKDLGVFRKLLESNKI